MGSTNHPENVFKCYFFEKSTHGWAGTDRKFITQNEYDLEFEVPLKVAVPGMKPLTNAHGRISRTRPLSHAPTE